MLDTINAIFEKIKGYKTFVWGLLPAFFMLLVDSGITDEGFQQWLMDLASQYWEIFLGIYSAGVVLLRAITDTPIFKGKKEE